MKRLGKLTPDYVKKVNEPGYHLDRDGYGLALRARQTKTKGLSKTWIQKLEINGKPTNRGLGSYPQVTLDEARRRAQKNWNSVKEDRDPSTRNQPTFKQLAEQVIKDRSPGWRPGGGTRQRWENNLRKNAYPRIGDKRVGRITSGDIIACLEPIWHTKPETARHLFYYIRAVIEQAVLKNYRDSDPTPLVSVALGPAKAKVKHYQSVGHSQVPEVLRVIASTKAHWATIALFKFQTLTATRPGEARGARWEEIDYATATWTIPADRMKSGTPHQVPLSQAALAILDQAREQTGGNGPVFPSRSGRHLSDGTLSKLCKENNVGCTPHGMRSSFRDWCAKTEVPTHVADLALEHTPTSVDAISVPTWAQQTDTHFGTYTPRRAGAARARFHMLEARRLVMEAWAVYLTRTTAPN